MNQMNQKKMNQTKGILSLGLGDPYFSLNYDSFGIIPLPIYPLCVNKLIGKNTTTFYEITLASGLLQYVWPCSGHQFLKV